jgi:hypothetical protein
MLHEMEIRAVKINSFLIYCDEGDFYSIFSTRSKFNFFPLNRALLIQQCVILDMIFIITIHKEHANETLE